jgi:hypothetical protein
MCVKADGNFRPGIRRRTEFNSTLSPSSLFLRDISARSRCFSHPSVAWPRGTECGTARPCDRAEKRTDKTFKAQRRRTESIDQLMALNGVEKRVWAGEKTLQCGSPVAGDHSTGLGARRAFRGCIKITPRKVTVGLPRKSLAKARAYAATVRLVSESKTHCSLRACLDRRAEPR